MDHLTIEDVRRGAAKMKALGIALYEHGGAQGVVVPDRDGTRYPQLAEHATLIDLPVSFHEEAGQLVQVGLGGKGWFVPAEGRAAPAHCIRCGPIWVECAECSKSLGGERAEGQA